ncbi:hypothetical protein CVV38_02665 [Candidatus Peregrinibacteria bacterium HGW-Peregrinibacteria-1]|jgi:outer membrane biosynthesis protein TonB|nr:MAG: hypothetical protein CVV38_02665 [Candidatus Peregrinibacteria bacterium HGW-Peregrinibacteria-1]
MSQETNQNTTIRRPQIKHVYGFSRGLAIALIALAAGLFFMLKDFEFNGSNRYKGQLQKIEDISMYSQVKPQTQAQANEKPAAEISPTVPQEELEPQETIVPEESEPQGVPRGVTR